jgi:hypothetical protein
VRSIIRGYRDHKIPVDTQLRHRQTEIITNWKGHYHRIKRRYLCPSTRRIPTMNHHTVVAKRIEQLARTLGERRYMLDSENVRPGRIKHSAEIPATGTRDENTHTLL